MTRILVFSPYEPPSDGIARHTAHLAEAWDSSGHSVMIVSNGFHRGSPDVEPIGSRSSVARILRRTSRRKTWIDIVNFRPDIVFVQYAISTLGAEGLVVWSLCKKLKSAGVPVVVAYHEPAREYDRLGFVTRQVYRAMANVTDVPIVFSPAGRHVLVENGLFEEVVEVTLGTAGAVEITEADISRVREIYNVSKPLVLALGFTHIDKGVDVLLDSAPEIARRTDHQVKFIVAGSPRQRTGVFRIMGRRDIRCQKQLQDQAKLMPDVDVQFFGFVADENVSALLHLADVVAIPYRKITQSGVANLALASQSVIVSSDLPGLRSDLGDAAIYVEVGNPSAIAESIASLLADDSRLQRQQMRRLAGQRANEHSFPIVARAILAAGVARLESDAKERN